jgi:outer membrane protein OmpA-like peptidoglycan-associated protein
MKQYVLITLCWMLASTSWGQNPALKKQEDFKYTLRLKVMDRETLEELDGTYVRLFNQTTGRATDSTVVENGYATFTLIKGNSYELMSSRKGFLTRRGNFDAACYLRDPKLVFCLTGINIDNVSPPSRNTQEIEAHVSLKRIVLQESFKIENIYYDLDKWFIRPEAAKELDKLVTILKDNPQIIVELGSHTDSRASDAYNLTLSQRRAESAVAYIIKKGVSSKRISAKGYGETKLTNDCANGVACSEEQHQANRRTEVKITGLLADGAMVDMKGGQ